MPANLPPQYFEAEKVYRQSKTPEEKVEALETMLAIMPKHKGTDKLRAELRRRIAKFSDEALRRPTLSRKGSAYNIRKEGAGQVALVGLPNAGKSQLVSVLTEAFTTVADYPYATKEPLPGMMKFENIQIQLLDMPPITDREAKPWFSHLLRNADVLLIMIDLAEDPLTQLEAIFAELEGMKIKLGTKEGQSEELMPGEVRRRALIAGNKRDLDNSGRHYSILSSRCGGKFSVLAFSAIDKSTLRDLKQALYRSLGVIRVYTKSPGGKPDFEDPIILDKGSTVEDAAESVHKEFRSRLKYAQVWGSGKYDGQRVKRGHVLADGDVVELHA